VRKRFDNETSEFVVFLYVFDYFMMRIIDNDDFGSLSCNRLFDRKRRVLGRNI
jgi:hypothetical protein